MRRLLSVAAVWLAILAFTAVESYGKSKDWLVEEMGFELESPERSHLLEDALIGRVEKLFCIIMKVGSSKSLVLRIVSGSRQVREDNRVLKEAVLA
jgi:hypothetical protein